MTTPAIISNPAVVPTSYELVLVRDEGRVRILTLNRPEQRNALNAALRTELILCLQEAENNDAVGAIVLTGAGSAFAAGADLAELAARTTEQQHAFLQPPHIYSIAETLRKPIIAALNGHALGAGLELATACDLRIASRTAKLGQPEIALALIPGGGGTQRLVRLVGPGNAARLVLTGDAMAADEAYRVGLIDQVAEPGDLMGCAIAVAQRMAQQDPGALAAAKRALWAATNMSYEEGLSFEIEQFLVQHASEESRRRVAEFLARK